MQYKKLANLYHELSSTTKRLEKIKILSDFLRYVHEDDSEVLYLLLGEIYPHHDERRIGISNQLVIKAISNATGTEKEEVVKEWKSLGDLGEVAKKLKEKKSQSTLGERVLNVNKVLTNLRKLPDLEGKGTINKKLALIVELLTMASPIEAMYITRTLLRDLRIGLKESTIRAAMVSTFFPEDSKKEAAEKIQKSLDQSNDIQIVFKMAKEGNLESFDNLELDAEKPIKVMLAQKAKTISEGFEVVGRPCAIEYKYDGFRMTIHKKGNDVKLFTRRLENVTKQFPEIVEYVKKYVKGDSFILDSEVVGFDKKTKEYMPFQNISQRIRRKYDIEKLQEELPVEVNVFDIIYHDGKSLLEKPFEERTKWIKKILNSQKYKIIQVKQIITEKDKEAENFYKKALEEHQEGVMMKNLHAIYNPGSRVGTMLKIKPEERDYDLIITGAEYGTGKRSGWLSSFMISCFDSKKNEFLEVGKVATGLKEKWEEQEEKIGTSFHELTEKLKPLITKENGRLVEVKPKIVLSVTYQEIQKSPNYNSGFALRFPRFTALRPDKSPKDITTLSEIEKDYEGQKRS